MVRKLYPHFIDRELYPQHTECILEFSKFLWYETFCGILYVTLSAPQY